MQKHISKLLLIMLATLSLSACDQSGGGTNASDYTNPVSIGSAPTTYNGHVDAYIYGTSAGESFYYVDIAAGGAYNITLSNFTTDLDLYVFDKPFTDASTSELCSSWTSNSVESCSVTAGQTATLTRLYIYVTNWDATATDHTLAVN